MENDLEKGITGLNIPKPIRGDDGSVTSTMVASRAVRGPPDPAHLRPKISLRRKESRTRPVAIWNRGDEGAGRSTILAGGESDLVSFITKSPYSAEKLCRRKLGIQFGHANAPGLSRRLLRF